TRRRHPTATTPADRIRSGAADPATCRASGAAGGPAGRTGGGADRDLGDGPGQRSGQLLEDDEPADARTAAAGLGDVAAHQPGDFDDGPQQAHDDERACRDLRGTWVAVPHLSPT